jgi:hypothetical protein
MIWALSYARTRTGSGDAETPASGKFAENARDEQVSIHGLLD